MAKETKGAPLFFQKLHKAFKLGNLGDKKELVGILDGIGTCLANGTTKGRRLNDTEKQFYTCLLNSASPRVCNFIPKNLLGPSMRAVKRFRITSLP